MKRTMPWKNDAVGSSDESSSDSDSDSDSGSGSEMENKFGSTNRRKDPGWKYGILQNEKVTNDITCLYCMKVIKGGIRRFKEHLVGGFPIVTKCRLVPQEVSEELKDYMLNNEAANQFKGRKGSRADSDFVDLDHDDYMSMGEEELGHSSGRSHGVGSGSGATSRRDPLDAFVSRAQRKSKGKLVQMTLYEKQKKIQREDACSGIARWFYAAGIAFNTAKLPEFKDMIRLIGIAGENMKPPSYHELTVPLLSKELASTKEYIELHKKQWSEIGCTILFDGWTDRSDRSLINFLVKSPLGTVLIESIDSSSYSKTGEKVFELLDNMVEKIGEKNVIQVVTDNASNFVLAGKFLMVKRMHLFWTPCAAHCIDQMLEDIGKLSRIYKVIKRAVKLSGYIYNHSGVLNMMREKTKRELVRPGKTRFVTSFLTLESIYKCKVGLRNMFNDEKWTTSRWAREQGGKEAERTVMTPGFWNGITYILKVFRPLVTVLRLVDGDKKPAMPYIYEAMDRVKEAIAASFNNQEEKYVDVFAIIDKRWECQLYHPLHAAAHFLNPEFFYKDPSIQSNSKIVSGLFSCIERLILDVRDQDTASTELSLYKNARGLFGNPLAIRQRATLSPAEWWGNFGVDAPVLRGLAIRILSLACSACGCERNWSVFEQIHTKKRNKLDQENLNDLAFVKYNQKLKWRYDHRDVVDPISMGNFDECNEWMVGRMQEEMDMDDDDVAVVDDVLANESRSRASVSAPIPTLATYSRRVIAGSSTKSHPIPNDDDLDEFGDDDQDLEAEVPIDGGDDDDEIEPFDEEW